MNPSSNKASVIEVRQYFSEGSGWELLEEARSRIRRGDSKLVLDFQGIKQINSREVGVVAACVKSARDAEGDVKLSSLSAFVEKIFRIAGMNTVIDIHPDANGALKSFEQ